MGSLCSKTDTVPSVPTPEKNQSTQPTSIPDGTTSTPSPRTGTAMSARMRAQSHGAALSQRRHDDDREDMRSRQNPPGGTGRMQRTRSVSMDVTALQGAPLQSSSRRNRTASSATGQSAAGRQGARSRFPFALQSLLPNDFRFRILVVGKRDSGKSSLIKTIFKVDMSGSPINISGRTGEFRPRDNRHLIVHECSASGPGEIQAIRDFITTRNHKSRPASERLHAIWICIPISDVIHGQVDEGVKMLLDIGVPFVIVFTKFDQNVSSSHNDYEERCRSLFGNAPADIVSTQPKFRHLINKLVAKTDGVIIAHSRNISAPSEAQRTQPRLSPVSLAWSVSQRASRDINVQAAIEVGRSRYWRRLWSSDDFVGQSLANCVEIIHADIVGTWNLPDKDKYLSSTAFKAEISYLVQDLTGSPINTSSRHRLDGTPGTGAAWLNGRYENSNENICLVMGYIVDLTVILCGVFGPHGSVSASGAQSVINNFANSSLKTSIHNDISSFIRTVPQFQYYDNDVVTTARLKDPGFVSTRDPVGHVVHVPPLRTLTATVIVMSRMRDHLGVVEQGRGGSEMTAPPLAGGAAAQPQHDGRREIDINDSSRTPEPSNEPAQDFDEGSDDLWSLYGKEAKSHDEEWIKVLKEDIDTALIFAGLLSAVLTAFVVPKIQDLKVDPADQSAYYQNQTVHMLDRISQQFTSVDRQIPSNYTPPLPFPTFHPSASDRRVNIVWLISLVCSLSASLLATLVQQWARSYMRIFRQSRNPLKAARIRLFLFEGAQSLPSIVEFVPGLIQISLLLFLWGLGEMVLHIDKTLFITYMVSILFGVCLYLIGVFLPIWNLRMPYLTPFSRYIWRLIQIMRNLYIRIRIGLVKLVEVGQVTSMETYRERMEAYREQYAMEQTDDCKKRDVRAIKWLVDNINGNNEMQAFVLAISGSFNRKWGRDVWKRVVNNDLLTSSVGQPRPGLSSMQKGTTVYRFCRCVRNFFESESEGGFVDSKVQRTRMRGCIETAASLVCCVDVKLESFGEVTEVLSKVGDKEQTNKSLSIGSNPLFTVRWTCLSLVAIKQIVNDNRLKELAKFALEGIARFQTNLGSRDTVTMAQTATQKMDDNLKKAWEAVLDLRLALEPWSQNKNKTESEIRSIVNRDTCKSSIKKLERIAMEAVGLNEVDWRVRLLQETMEEVTHKLTRCLPGVFFYELPPTAPNMTSEAFNLLSVQTTPSPIPPQLIFPGQQLQSIYILGQRLRDITKRENTEWDEETLKSLKYLREVPIPFRGLNYLMKRQLWRLLDLQDGGGLGFTIELFFLALRQLSSASPSPDKSSSSELEKEFYTGTFDVIKSNWKKSKNSAGTQRIPLDLLCDLIIRGRGIFSDFPYPRYIVERLLDLVGEMVEGLGLQSGRHPHIDNVLDELMDESLRNRMNMGLRAEALSTIHRSLDTVSS